VNVISVALVADSHFSFKHHQGALGEFLIEKGADDMLENALGLSPYDGITND
jgi:hypothetical protein